MIRDLDVADGAYFSLIEETFRVQFEREYREGTEWVTGSQHIRVWPYDNDSFMKAYVLLLGPDVVRVFRTSEEARDHMDLRGITPKASSVRITDVRARGFTGTSAGMGASMGASQLMRFFYEVYSINPDGKTGVITLFQGDLNRLLGPQEIDYLKARENMGLEPNNPI